MNRIHVAVLSLAWIGAAEAQTPPPPAAPPPASAVAHETDTGASAAMSRGELQELVAASRATAQATREGVDYTRVMPDILQQILAKLDKIETKLDRIDSHLPLSRKGR